MDSKKIGEAIKLARKKNKLSQKELSELCDIPVISIGRYERGERTPSINTLCDISKALGINPMDLMGEKEKDAINKSVEILSNSMNNIKMAAEAATNIIQQGIREGLLSDKYLCEIESFSFLDEKGIEDIYKSELKRLGNIHLLSQNLPDEAIKELEEFTKYIKYKYSNKEGE